MKNKKGSEQNIIYMPIFMSIGISIGVAIGAALGNIPLYMCIGLSIGVGLGACIDARNKKSADGEDQPSNDKKDEE